MTLVIGKSAIAGAVCDRDIPVTPIRLKRWLVPGSVAPHIQDACPDLSDDDREFPMNGTTPEEWQSLRAFPSRRST